MAKKPKAPKGKRVVIHLLDEPTGLGFQAQFLPGGTYEHASPAHQYGRLLLAHLHQELKSRGAMLEYEQGKEHVETHDLPTAPEPSPILLPPDVRVH